MDRETRARYTKWRRKRIIKQLVIPTISVIILAVFLNIRLGREQNQSAGEREKPYINAINQPIYHFNIESTTIPAAEETTVALNVEIIEDFSCDDVDMTPILNALERYGEGVAIYFENLATGCTISHHADREFFGASIGKAPFALWLYTQAEQGYINLNEMIYYTYEDSIWGSGIIRHNYEIGQSFTVRRTIALNLYESDNVATHMLRRRFGFEDYVDFITNLGGTAEFAGNILYSRITANEVGLFAREIFEYIESNQQYSEEFKQNLLNNQFPFITSNYPVASKTGWYEHFGGAWHDMAIIYAPSPFILVILSSNRTGTPEDHAVYQYLSRAFCEFNRINFSPTW